MKLQTRSVSALIAVAGIFLFSCSTKPAEEPVNYTFHSGECYFLPDSVSFGHGLILIPGDTSQPERWYLAPVFLDSASTGLDKFRLGNLQLQNYLDMKSPTALSYAPASLQPQNNASLKETLGKLTLAGTLKFKDAYRKATTGRAFANLTDVKNILSGWQRFYLKFEKTPAGKVFE